MSVYFLTVYCDMGHLMVSDYHKIPEGVTKAVYRQAFQDLYEARDKEGLGCLFHILKDGKSDRVTFDYKDNVISVVYDVYQFDPERMIKNEPYPLPPNLKE